MEIGTHYAGVLYNMLLIVFGSKRYQHNPDYFFNYLEIGLKHSELIYNFMFYRTLLYT